jgi:voltage-gated potassium channel
MRPNVQERLDRLRLRGAVLLIVTTAVVLASAAAILERWIDPASFPTMGDALWFTVATVTTVGYGDIVPESSGGRVIASGLMLLGLGLIPVLTSVVVSILISRRSREERKAEEQEFAKLLAVLQSVDDRLARLEARAGGQ